MLRVNYIFAITMSLLALFFYVLSLSYTEDAAQWPQFFVVILVLLCIALIVDSHKNPNREKSEASESNQDMGKTSYVVYTIVGSILYLIILEFFGFLLLTPIFLIVLFKLIGYKSNKLILFIAFGVTISVILIFQYMLNIPIPQGILEEIFI
ncbi:tripartite tricarboxylate transporter TctB family protein [Aquibacillus sediminis]|uniref:tripartite tricarboxylate transporter TctB family protein n=1 Tax=Aquibacillus sediminis TaxID=2574734 RepID=UPI0011098C4D|nr:tripartite tricarboxylate transporter TctB family protein [Aquibacillus sediminis]